MSNLPSDNSGQSVYRNFIKKINVGEDQNYREVAGVILNFVRNYWLENGFSPSMDEIATGCGYHRASAYYWVHRMREKNDLVFGDKVARSIRLPGQTVNFPDENEVK